MHDASDLVFKGRPPENMYVWTVLKDGRLIGPGHPTHPDAEVYGWSHDYQSAFECSCDLEAQ